MKRIWEAVRDFFERDWTMTEKILIIVCCVLIGTLRGFLLAPIKKGISVGNNNGNTYSGTDEEFWLDEDEEA